jgi:hypothetical protein
VKQRHQEVWLLGFKFLLLKEGFGRTNIVLLFELGDGRGRKSREILDIVPVKKLRWRRGA